MRHQFQPDATGEMIEISEKFTWPNHDHACVLCGKPLDNKQYNMVHVVNGGSSITTRQFNERDGADMGFFPVGIACSKRFPSDFVFNPHVVLSLNNIYITGKHNLV